jgi:hypothetical protein
VQQRERHRGARRAPITRRTPVPVETATAAASQTADEVQHHFPAGRSANPANQKREHEASGYQVARTGISRVWAKGSTAHMPFTNVCRMNSRGAVRAK